MTRWLLVLFLLVSGPATAAETLRFYGYAYDLKTDRLLYTEVHEQEVAGNRWLRGRIGYFLADGRKLGEKSLDFSADPFVPVFRLDLALEGYMEAVTAVGDSMTMERRAAKGAKLESKTVKREGPTCADSGFHAFLVSNFGKLMKKETIALRLAVAGSLDQFKFRARRIDDTTFEGQPAVRFYIEPDSLLRFVVDPLELTYDPKTQRLLEYRGISNIRDPQTGKPYLTRIAYYSQPPKNIGKLPPLEF